MDKHAMFLEDWLTIVKMSVLPILAYRLNTIESVII